MEPRIKFNNGEPVCLCSNCNYIITHIKYDENEKPITLENQEPPIFCNKCLDIIGDSSYEESKINSLRKAESIIESCTTLKHIQGAELFLNNFKKIFGDETIYHELMVFLYEKERELKIN